MSDENSGNPANALELVQDSAGLAGQLFRRRRNRRNKRTDLDGLARAHDALINEIEKGQVSLAKGEVLSRAYARQGTLVNAITAREIERERIAVLRNFNLAELPGGPDFSSLVQQFPAAERSSRDTKE